MQPTLNQVIAQASGDKSTHVKDETAAAAPDSTTTSPVASTDKAPKPLPSLSQSSSPLVSTPIKTIKVAESQSTPGVVTQMKEAKVFSDAQVMFSLQLNALMRLRFDSHEECRDALNIIAK